MPNWLESMTQTFEYYKVDPGTWKDTDRIKNVKNCVINRDGETDTLGSATIDIMDSIGESYVRSYLVTIQNGITEKHPLGTFLVQTPSSTYDGKTRSVSVDAYTPLIELKESLPPIGYSIPKGSVIMDSVYMLTRENLRAPVIKAESSKTLSSDFVANTDDTWFSFLTDLTENANYAFDLDELSRIIYAPKQDINALQPVWTYTDDNSSILYPEVTVKHDLYDIPNIVEISYSSGSGKYNIKVVNNDPNSPTSTVSRGRNIVYRVTNPSLTGNPTQEEVKEYAEQLLKELSTLEYEISYTHGYCPVRIGDCVRVNYSAAGLQNVKAKVVSQTIKCEPGCPVTERAVFTTKLWR